MPPVPKLCKHKVITVTIVLEGAAQSPFFYVLSLSWPILFGDFLAETLSFPQELKGLFSSCMITRLSGTHPGPQNSDRDGCVPSLGGAIHSSAHRICPHKPCIQIKSFLCFGSSLRGTLGYKTAVGLKGTTGREEAGWL